MKNQNINQKRPLTAFISGCSPKNLTEYQLRSSLNSLFPFKMKISIPKNSRYWKGFGFVDFSIREEFMRFINKKRIRLKEFEMNLVIKAHKEGKRLKKYQKNFQKRKLQVRGIPKNWNDLDLEIFF